MARSRSSNIRYNPRTGEFEGWDDEGPLAQHSGRLSKSGVGNANSPSQRSIRPARNRRRSCGCGCLKIIAGLLVIWAVVAFWNHRNASKAHPDSAPKADIEQGQRQQSSQRVPQANVRHSGTVTSGSRPVCRRCGGRGQVCANCRGTGYALRKCGRCQGSGKKDASERAGETVGNIIALPFVAIGNMFGGNAEMKVEATLECPECNGSGTLRNVCSHGGGSVACPVCGIKTR